MSWGAPTMFWLLLLIPAVLLLWFLKIRRTEKVVSSTVLWRRALQDERVRSPFQRLLKNLVLLLQLIAVLLAVLALAAPESGSQKFTSRLNLILIDTSASMNSVESDGTTRFELARSTLEDVIEEISGERGMLIQFGSRAQSLTPVTSDLSLLREMVAGLSAGSGTSNFNDALELALSIAKQDAVVPMPTSDEAAGSEDEVLQQQIDARIFVVTDGAFPKWSGGPIPVPVLTRSVGEASGNSGIVALAARREFSEEGDLRVVVEIRNTGDEVISGELELHLDGEPIEDPQPRSLEGGERWTRSFSLEGSGTHRISAHWNPDGGDALSLDDDAWLIASRPREIRVARVGEKNILLDDALAVIPSVTVESLELDEVDPETAVDEFDVIVWDRVVPEILPPGPGHLVIGARPLQFWPDEIARVEQPLLVAWKRDDPVLRYSQLGAIDGTVLESYPLPPGPGISAMAQCREGALIARFSGHDVRGIAIAFDVLSSPWPLTPSFPFFIEASLRDLARIGGGIESGIRSGDLIEVAAGAGARRATLTEPGGVGEREVSMMPGGFLRSPAGDQLGIYAMKWQIGEGEAERWIEKLVPVNLLSPAESSIEPKPAIAGITGGQEREAAGIWGNARRELWKWFLAAAVVLMLMEWIAFHRR